VIQGPLGPASPNETSAILFQSCNIYHLCAMTVFLLVLGQKPPHQMWDWHPWRAHLLWHWVFSADAHCLTNSPQLSIFRRCYAGALLPRSADCPQHQVSDPGHWILCLVENHWGPPQCLLGNRLASSLLWSPDLIFPRGVVGRSLG
jgi:hypothetical protein